MKLPESRDREHAAAQEEEPPPFLRTWNRLYVAIIVFTLVLVVLLYVMTVTLNR